MQRDYSTYRKGYRRTQVGKAKDLLTAISRRCKAKGLPFDLDEQWLATKIQYGRCEQTGIAFDFSEFDGGHRSPWAFSIDRIDVKGGHTKANTQAVVWAYNAAKGEGSDADVFWMAKCLLGLIEHSERGTVIPMPINGKHRRHVS